MVYNPTGDSRQRKAEVVLCNPVIVEYSDEKDVEEEGCLSFPGFTADVERSIWIKVEFQDMKGRKQEKAYEGWEARIFQHEYDHLNRVLYVDRLSKQERRRIQVHLDDLIATHGPGGAI